MTDDGKPPSSDDVLAAIRRLVSGSGEPEKHETENAKAMIESPKRKTIADHDPNEFDPQPEGEGEGTSTPNHFLLTPSLRVHNEPDQVEFRSGTKEEFVTTFNQARDEIRKAMRDLQNGTFIQPAH